MLNTKKVSVKKQKKIKKVKKIDELLDKIDYVENRLKTLPNLMVNKLSKFYDKNKYIIYLVVVMLLASYGYNLYNKIRDYNKTGEKVSDSINKLNKIINTDDLYLNDTQKLFKNFYLYLTQADKNDRTQFNILKELYDKHTSSFINDADKKIQIQFKNSTLPYLRTQLNEVVLPDINKFVQEKTIPDTLQQVKSVPGNIVTSITGGVTSLFGSAATSTTNSRCIDLQSELIGDCSKTLSEFEILLKEVSEQDTLDCFNNNLDEDSQIFLESVSEEIDNEIKKLSNEEINIFLDKIIELYKNNQFGNPDIIQNILKCLNSKKPNKGLLGFGYLGL